MRTPDLTSEQRLERYLLWSCPVQVLATVLVLVIFFFTHRDLWILGLAAGVVVMSGLTVWGVAQVHRGYVERALLSQLIGLWILAVTDTAIVPYVLPCFVAVVILGAIVALPYLSRGTLRAVLVATTVVALAVGLLGELQDWTGLTARLPPWVPEVVVVVTLPLPVLFATLLLWNYRITLIEALADARQTAGQLVASRQRVVASADHERRRIERDLHDGAQQTLMAILMRSQTDRYPKDELARDVRLAIEELRRLAQGIYPPLLAQRGLPAALTMTAQRALLPTTVDCQSDGRYADSIEATVYFCVLEALQNSAKHAGPQAHASITLRRNGPQLRFEIRDTGVGFDPQRVPAGAGLRNMADRVGATGGQLLVQSTPAGGTRICGTLPVEPLDPVGRQIVFGQVPDGPA